MRTLFQAASDVLPHITYLGKVEYPANWQHFHRDSNEYILFLMCSGKMYLDENGTKYELEPGDAIILEPGYEHHGYKPSACSFIFAHFRPASFRVLSDFSTELYHKEIQKLLHVNYNESPISDALYQNTTLFLPKLMHFEDGALFYQIVRIFTEAIKKNQSRRIYYKSVASCHVFEALTLISNAWIDMERGHLGENISSGMYEKVNALLDYLHTSYSEKITGCTIEKKLSINFDYLNRIFKKRTGNTIFSYLNQLRIEQAKQLLLTTALPLSEIASLTGFSDEYYFNRSFKKTVGTPPSRYRNGQLPATHVDNGIFGSLLME